MPAPTTTPAPPPRTRFDTTSSRQPTRGTTTLDVTTTADVTTGGQTTTVAGNTTTVVSTTTAGQTTTTEEESTSEMSTDVDTTPTMTPNEPSTQAPTTSKQSVAPTTGARTVGSTSRLITRPMVTTKSTTKAQTSTTSTTKKRKTTTKSKSKTTKRRDTTSSVQGHTTTFPQRGTTVNRHDTTPEGPETPEPSTGTDDDLLALYLLGKLSLVSFSPLISPVGALLLCFTCACCALCMNLCTPFCMGGSRTTSTTDASKSWTDVSSLSSYSTETCSTDSTVSSLELVTRDPGAVGTIVENQRYNMSRPHTREVREFTMPEHYIEEYVDEDWPVYDYDLRGPFERREVVESEQPQYNRSASAYSAVRHSEYRDAAGWE